MPPTETDEGIRFAAELRSSHPDVGVVVLSQHADPVYATTLFQHGSRGRAYLLKERVRHPGDLNRAVREVAAGGPAPGARLVVGLIGPSRAGEFRRPGGIPPRVAACPRPILAGRCTNASRT